MVNWLVGLMSKSTCFSLLFLICIHSIPIKRRWRLLRRVHFRVLVETLQETLACRWINVSTIVVIVGVPFMHELHLFFSFKQLVVFSEHIMPWRLGRHPDLLSLRWTIAWVMTIACVDIASAVYALVILWPIEVCKLLIWSNMVRIFSQLNWKTSWHTHTHRGKWFLVVREVGSFLRNVRK